MRDVIQDATQMEKKRLEFLETGFRLFAERSIEAVTLPEVAKEAGYGTATLYRYFDKKPGFVIAVATWKWEKFTSQIQKRRQNEGFDGMTAAEAFGFYLDSFLELYRNHADLLRFNQFFNIYIRSEQISPDIIQPYQDMIDDVEHRFHRIYEKAEKDHTMRTDIAEKEVFTTTLHLMLAVLTRYAVGLVYTPKDGFNMENELLLFRNMLYNQYCR